LLLASSSAGHADPDGARGLSGAIRGDEAGRSASAPAQSFSQRVLTHSRRLRDRLSAHHAARAGATETTNSSEPEATSRAEGYHVFEGVPFVRGEGDAREIDANDPRQGGLGDCYLVAAMIAVAHTDPGKIRAMIQDRGDGTYGVRLSDVGVFWIDSVQVVSNRLPYVTRSDEPAPVYARSTDTRSEGERTLYELWPALIEKAYAQYQGGYQEIVSGRVSDAMAFMSGGEGADVTVVSSDTSAESIQRLLDRALREGNPLAVGMKKEQGELAAELGVVGNHGYVVMAAEDGGYRLYNPWGTRHPSRPITADELRQMISGVHVGDF